MIGESKTAAQATVSRTADYIELMKPELTSLSVLTALCGLYLATSGSFNYWLLFHLALGTALVGGGAGALNQWMEREYDALMRRTERRPLPSGRLSPPEVLFFGITSTVLGLLHLTLFVNFLTGFLGAITAVTYLFLYTPLKRITPLATFVGAVTGAIPPMMGWTAVRNEISVESWVLFLVLFCWQMPHFFSLAWIYRKDYARARYKMLSVFDPDGRRTSHKVLFYCAALLPVSAMSTVLGVTGPVYFAGALLLGAAFFSMGIMLFRSSGQTTPEATARLTSWSRRIFLASLVYLPLLMLLMTLDKV